jgi:hypothetical protein
MTTEIPVSREAAEFKQMCPGYKPIMTTIPAKNGRRIIAIGDTHGDWKTTMELLTVAKLITVDRKGEPHWSAVPADTILVQLGDQIDRCRPGKFPCSSKEATFDDEASDIDIINMFTRLHNEAQKVGGAVYSLLGNHELMNVDGDFRYVSRKNLDFNARVSKHSTRRKDKSDKTLYLGVREYNNKYGDDGGSEVEYELQHGENARRAAFAPGGTIARELACTRSSVLIIGGCLFAHAGVVPGLLNAPQTGTTNPIGAITWFNQTVRKWLLGQVNVQNVTSIINSMKISPFWNRILGKIPNGVDSSDPSCQTHLIPVFKALKLGKMIIGHTPQLHLSEGNTTCDESLVRIDIGSSQAFQGIDGFGKRKRPVRVAEIIVGGGVKIITNE